MGWESSSDKDPSFRAWSGPSAVESYLRVVRSGSTDLSHITADGYYFCCQQSTCGHGLESQGEPALYNWWNHNQCEYQLFTFQILIIFTNDNPPFLYPFPVAAVCTIQGWRFNWSKQKPLKVDVNHDENKHSSVTRNPNGSSTHPPAAIEFPY